MAPWLDPLMILISSKWVWLPFYLVILFAFIKKYKMNVWVVLLLLGITVSLSDSISSKLLKPNVKRIRPNQIEKVSGVKMLEVENPRIPKMAIANMVLLAAMRPILLPYMYLLHCFYKSEVETCG